MNIFGQVNNIINKKQRKQKDNNEKHNENNACIINICFNS